MGTHEGNHGQVRLDPILTQPSCEFFQSKDFLIGGSTSKQGILETKNGPSTYDDWTETTMMGTRSQKERFGDLKSPRARSLAYTGALIVTSGPAMKTTQTNMRKKNKTTYQYQDLTRMFNSLDITVVRNKENRKLPPLLQTNSRAALTGAFKQTGWSRPLPVDDAELERSAAENTAGFRRLLRSGKNNPKFITHDESQKSEHPGGYMSGRGSRDPSKAREGVTRSPTSQRNRSPTALQARGDSPKVPKLSLPEVKPEFTESNEMIKAINVQEGPEVNLSPVWANNAGGAETSKPSKLVNSEDYLDLGQEVRDQLYPLSPAKPPCSISSRKSKILPAEPLSIRRFDGSLRSLNPYSDRNSETTIQGTNKNKSKVPDLNKLFSNTTPNGGALPNQSDLMDLTCMRAALSQALKKEMMVDAKRPFLETIIKPRGKEVKYYLTDVKIQSELEETFRTIQQPNGLQQPNASPTPSWMKGSTIAGSKIAKSGSRNPINSSIFGGEESEIGSPGLKKSKLYKASQGPSRNKLGSKLGSKHALASSKEPQYTEIEKSRIKHLLHFQNMFKQLRMTNNLKTIDDEVAEKRLLYSMRITNIFSQVTHPSGVVNPTQTAQKVNPVPVKQMPNSSHGQKTVRFQTNNTAPEPEPVRWLFFELESTLAHIVHVQSQTQEYNTSYVTQTGQRKRLFVKLRPYLVECLERLQSSYVLCIYTTMHRVAAEKVLEMIDPLKGLFKVVMCNEVCLRVSGSEVDYLPNLRN
jgi:NLI interacting factor-like phosphatase